MVTAIKTALKCRVSECFIRLFLDRLDSLGCLINEDDTMAVVFAISRGINHVECTCNITDIPDELTTWLVDYCCAVYLEQAYSLNRLPDSFDLGRAVKSVQEGDTTVTFDSASDSNDGKFKALLTALYGKEGDLVCFKQMKW